MDRLHEMEVFAAVANAGGFAKAGRRLGISPPAVTRAVSALEARLGTRLLNRTTRNVSLTEAGLRYLDTAKRLLAEIDAAEQAALGAAAVPTGPLSVSASVTFGRWVVAPIVSEFLRTHPRVTASLLLLDRVVNLVEEGIEVAVRIGQLPDSSLVARRVGEVQRVLVASPDYLAHHGEPRSPADLKRHAIIAMRGLTPSHEWRFVDGPMTVHVAVQPRFEVNDALSAIDAAEAGDGITGALSYMVAQKIAEGRLAPVLMRHAPPAMPVQLVHLQSRLVSPKVRAFVDFAGPRLAEQLRRLPPIPAHPPPKGGGRPGGAAPGSRARS